MAEPAADGRRAEPYRLAGRRVWVAGHRGMVARRSAGGWSARASSC